jgi:hypothetical protein
VSDIFKEIDEELRRDNLAKLWQRYGTYVIAFAVVVVVATGATVAWREYQQRLRASEGERFAVALDLARLGKFKEAGGAFAGLAQDSSRRAVLARLEMAALEARGGDVARAQASYEAIAADASVDMSVRDLATILAAQYGLASTDPKRLIDRLQPYLSDAGPWQPSALELTALAQLKAGDKAAAHATYQRLADDLAAPQGMRSRAAEMVAVLAP